VIVVVTCQLYGAFSLARVAQAHELRDDDPTFFSAYETGFFDFLHQPAEMLRSDGHKLS
jgi:hypothetical protein